MRRSVLLTPIAVAAIAAVPTLAFGDRAAKVVGNPKAGKPIFVSTCAVCHTLKAAKSNGRDGPNLDRSKLSYAAIVTVITKGRKETRKWPTGMPGYSGSHAALSKRQIQNNTELVYTTTR